MNTQTPDYGEPWHQQEPPHPISKDKGVYWLNPEQFNRACECVNACAGMADPAAEIQAMREAIKEAHSLLFVVTGSQMDINNVNWHDASAVSPTSKRKD